MKDYITGGKTGYTEKEKFIAWDEAFEKKICDKSITQNEEVNLQEALEVYFEHLSDI